MKIVPVFHGKTGGGYLTQFYPPVGDVTYLAITQDKDGHFKFVVAEGVNEPGPIFTFGDTNMRTRFSCGAREFVNRWSEAGPTHHMAAATGHHIDTILKVDLQRAGGCDHSLISGCLPPLGEGGRGPARGRMRGEPSGNCPVTGCCRQDLPSSVDIAGPLTASRRGSQHNDKGQKLCLRFMKFPASRALSVCATMAGCRAGTSATAAT